MLVGRLRSPRAFADASPSDKFQKSPSLPEVPNEEALGTRWLPTILISEEYCDWTCQFGRAVSLVAERPEAAGVRNWVQVTMPLLSSRCFDDFWVSIGGWDSFHPTFRICSHSWPVRIVSSHSAADVDIVTGSISPTSNVFGIRSGAGICKAQCAAKKGSIS